MLLNNSQVTRTEMTVFLRVRLLYALEKVFRAVGDAPKGKWLPVGIVLVTPSPMCLKI